MKDTLQTTEKHIQPGVTRLNWQCLGIKEYALSSEKLLKGLNSIVVQLNRIKADLDNRIDFEYYNLYSTRNGPEDLNYELISCKVSIFTNKLRSFISQKKNNL